MDGSPPSHFYEAFHNISSIVKVLSVCCYCVAFIVGSVGNGLVIWIAGFRMKTVSAVWFANLAIIDFLFCVSLPLSIMEWLWLDVGELFFYTPIIHWIRLQLNSNVSIIFITVISIDRWVSVMWPFWSRVHRTRKLAIVVSLVIWTVPQIIGVVWTFTLNSSTVPLSYTHVQRDFFSIFNDTYFDIVNVSFVHTLSPHFHHHPSFFTFTLCLTIIPLCNCMIVLKLQNRAFKRPKTLQKTLRVTIAVVVCFFICWIPYYIWPVIEYNRNSSTEFLTNFTVNVICVWLATISSCINPVIYVLVGQKHKPNNKRSIKAKLEETMENAMNEPK
ncbi:formyl peptide receptor-related sequence 4-like [Hyperolius riggenbachi]|uniref:formyl peptide receptor-related sequence 4-like n=1 Tax=Hyperolius riggenbachi TaxID=752182 RepID=UPI0035A2CC59